MWIMSPTAILNPRIPNFQFLNLPSSLPTKSFRSQFPPHSLNFSLLNQSNQPLEDEEHVIGDCIVFEEGIFDDPFVQNKPQNNKKNKPTEIQAENLIPEEWVEVQREINITKKERRKLSQQLEFGQRAERRRLELRPISNDRGGSSNIEEYLKAREEKLKQLKPLVLENPDFSKVKNEEKSDTEVSEIEEERFVSSERVLPRDPRLAVYGGGLDDIKEFFNSGIYEANVAQSTEAKSLGDRPSFEDLFMLRAMVRDEGEKCLTYVHEADRIHVQADYKRDEVQADHLHSPIRKRGKGGVAGRRKRAVERGQVHVEREEPNQVIHEFQASLVDDQATIDHNIGSTSRGNTQEFTPASGLTFQPTNAHIVPYMTPQTPQFSRDPSLHRLRMCFVRMLLISTYHLFKCPLIPRRPLIEMMKCPLIFHK